MIIGGEEVRTGSTFEAVCPHDHGHVLATYHQAGEAEDVVAGYWKLQERSGLYGVNGNAIRIEGPASRLLEVAPGGAAVARFRLAAAR